MALSIKSERADQLARELAEITGESLTEAVTTAIEIRLDAVRRTKHHRRSTLALAHEFRRLPVLDGRPADEILGYDEAGLPR